jgi:hypothetical protein
MCQLSDWPWGMIGALGSWVSIVVTLCIGVYVIRDVRRLDRPRKTGERPGTAYFVIPSSLHHSCDFAQSDECSHLVKSITLSSHSVIIVDLYIESNISIKTDQVYFGFPGDFHRTPFFSEVCNRFMTKGPRQHVTPGDGSNQDYTDKHKFYHAVENWSWSIGDGKAYGFKIHTERAGIYALDINFLGDISAGKIDELQVVVEDEPRHLCLST